jgi:hypothetical protein
MGRAVVLFMQDSKNNGTWIGGYANVGHPVAFGFDASTNRD